MSSDDKESFIIDASRQTVSSDPGVTDSKILKRHKIDLDGIEFDRLPPFRLTPFEEVKKSPQITFSKGGSSNGALSKNPDTGSIKDLIDRENACIMESMKKLEEKGRTPGPVLSRSQRRKLGKKLKDKSKGFHWYDMQAAEMTAEKLNDLTVVQMRKALDPKHFYKRSALNTDSTPKFFEVGTYEESPLDFYSSRVPKKQRKQTLVDELMADAEFRNYQKKKMSEALRSQPPKKFHKKSKKSKEKNVQNKSSVKKQKTKRN